MVKLEVFSGNPPCPGCVALVELAQRVAARYDESELELVIYEGAAGMEKFEEYRLFCVPAAVVNGTIRIEGMSPSEGTLNNALREGGLWIR
ncbi:MAG: thioredoxin family protein [Anaerolineales bacterium]